MNKITTAWACFFMALCFGKSPYVINGLDPRSNPSIIDYQGYLTDLTNVPITNPSQSLTFGIYSASSGGSPIWSETQSAVNVKQGIFHVLLGSVVPLPDTVFTRNSTRWLALSVGGQIMTPRTRIVSAGYVYHAGHADSVEYVRFPNEDYDWTRGTPDSVLFTYRQLGIARGDAGDSLLGTNRFTHVNFGTSSNSGATGFNYSNCAILGGQNNRVRGDYSAAVGGYYNRTNANCAVVAGGFRDSVTVIYGGMLTGRDNLAADHAADSGAMVASGIYNKTTGKYGTIVGGSFNTANDYSVAFGGYYDTVRAVYSGVFNGNSNITGIVTSDTGCVIGSGWDNNASASYNAIGSGYTNWSSGTHTTIMGGNNQQSWGLYSGIISGYNNRSGNNGFYDTATVASGVNNKALENFAVVCGGMSDTASGVFSLAAGGMQNTAGNAYASIAGGYANSATGMYSAVSGGGEDTTRGPYAACLSGFRNLAGHLELDSGAVVGGGYNNNASGISSSIAGGKNNEAISSDYAVILGGLDNRDWGPGSMIYGGSGNVAVNGSVAGGGNLDSVNGDYCVMYGGYGNTIIGDYSVCLGGQANYSHAPFTGILSGMNNMAGSTARDTFAVVVGGVNNEASGRAAVVGGGRNNIADRELATIGGGRENYAWGENSTMMGGDTNYVASDFGGSLSGAMNQTGQLFEVGTLICGGTNNYTSDDYTTIGGGMCDSAINLYSTVNGGTYNYAHIEGAYVGGGSDNDAWSEDGTVAGGLTNYTGGNYGVVTGGELNRSWANAAVVGGGYANLAGYSGGSGPYSSVPGGYLDTVSTSSSFATGNHSVVRFGSTYNSSAAFNGQVATASGQLRCGIMAKTGGSFTIDHPLDPGGKILNHYFVESPDMSNVYRGIALTGPDGRAVVHLPDYFDRLNKEPFIQLTAESSAEWVFIEQNVKNNIFIICGAPNTRVHWLVTGARQDQPAEIIRTVMPVEQNKDGALAGRMLDDDFLVSTYGQLMAKGIADRFRFRSEQSGIRAREMEARTKEGR